jgi:hypothetical protein
VPVTVTVSETEVPGTTVVVPRLDEVVMVARQVLKSPSRKSFSLESNGVELRVSARKDETQPMSGTRRVRLIPPSKKLPCGNTFAVPLLGVYAHGEGVSPRFTVAHAGLSYAAGGGPTQSDAEKSRSRVPFEPPEPTHS